MIAMLRYNLKALNRAGLDVRDDGSVPLDQFLQYAEVESRHISKTDIEQCHSRFEILVEGTKEFVRVRQGFSDPDIDPKYPVIPTDEVPVNLHHITSENNMMSIAESGIRPACEVPGGSSRTHAYFFQDKCVALDAAKLRRKAVLRIAAREAAEAGVIFLRSSSGHVLSTMAVEPRFVFFYDVHDSAQFCNGECCDGECGKFAMSEQLAPLFRSWIHAGVLTVVGSHYLVSVKASSTSDIAFLAESEDEARENGFVHEWITANESPTLDDCRCARDIVDFASQSRQPMASDDTSEAEPKPIARPCKSASSKSDDFPKRGAAAKELASVESCYVPDDRDLFVDKSQSAARNSTVPADGMSQALSAYLSDSDESVAASDSSGVDDSEDEHVAPVFVILLQDGSEVFHLESENESVPLCRADSGTPCAASTTRTGSLSIALSGRRVVCKRCFAKASLDVVKYINSLV